MAASDDDPHPPSNGNRLDEKVKIPLPFDDALRGLLATEPDENGKAETQPAESEKK